MKKPIRTTLKIATVVFVLIFVKQLARYIINEIIVWDFNHEVYNTQLVKSLYVLNFSERYVVYYNHGDILYKKEDYAGAKEKFQKALDRHPPRGRVCDVRTNLSLSMVKLIDPNADFQTRYDLLEEAKQVLYEDDCAHEDDNNGQSSQSEKLEEEIKKLQEQSEKDKDKQDKDQNQNGNDGDGGDGGEGNDQGGDSKDKDGNDGGEGDKDKDNGGQGDKDKDQGGEGDDNKDGGEGGEGDKDENQGGEGDKDGNNGGSNGGESDDPNSTENIERQLREYNGAGAESRQRDLGDFRNRNNNYSYREKNW